MTTFRQGDGPACRWSERLDRRTIETDILVKGQSEISLFVNMRKTCTE